MTEAEKKELKELQSRLVELAYEFWLEEEMTKRQNKL
jgi:hypothetical protein